MRSLDVSRGRWDILFSDEAIRLGLRQVVIHGESDPSPCQDGLRSVCWKAFLLYGPLSQASWPKKLSDSRSAYSFLREHFLKYIDHPSDLQFSIDPLADDEMLKSPWNGVRQDEIDRDEILKDVERCMQDYSFFQEPSTQKILLDILFIYSKLHPDVGYRQGMHELLAPILWVVQCDALEPGLPATQKAEEAFMANVLDHQFIEQDAFNLFCAVMQTAKSFYELGDTTSPIVDRSRRIQDEYLFEVDPELATRLQAAEILPQIFLIRWIRLLFGREFGLEDTLLVWDVLFAESLSLKLVDMTCLAMLLRIRWQLLEADPAEALHLLMHYEKPPPPHGPTTLVQDAMYLLRNMTVDGGADVIARRSGHRPAPIAEHRRPPSRRPPALQLNQKIMSGLKPAAGSSGSPGRSPARYPPPQKGLETLFQEVSGSLQKRAEGWKVSRSVREAVNEVRRNVSILPSATGSPRTSHDSPSTPPSQVSLGQQRIRDLSRQLSAVRRRNKTLAGMMEDALKGLRDSTESSGPDQTTPAEDSLHIALAKMQFIQVYLANPDIPIPAQQSLQDDHSSEAGPEELQPTDSSTMPVVVNASSRAALAKQQVDAVIDNSPISEIVLDANPERRRGFEDPTPRDSQAHGRNMESGDGKLRPSTRSSLHSRPKLAQSPLSWMLGEGHHRSDFVSSSTPPPEERRESVPKIRPKHLFPDSRDGEGRNGSESEDDGFTLSSLRGRQLKD